MTQSTFSKENPSIEPKLAGADSILLRRVVPRLAQTQSDNPPGKLTLAGQGSFEELDPAILVPQVRLPAPKFIKIQSWAGLVEEASADDFSALLTDETNPENPLEYVTLPIDDVSESDRILVKPGATFYWSVGYKDSSSGQRERVSMLRFARHPMISDSERARMAREADELAALFEK